MRITHGAAIVTERRGRRRLMNEINVVPYIDVMLVLLVIFMITAPLITPGQIELPRDRQIAGAARSAARGDRQGGWQPQAARPFRSQAANRKSAGTELVEAIKRKQAVNTEQPVVIAGDKSVRYEEVINVMDILQQQQVKKVGLLARPK